MTSSLRLTPALAAMLLVSAPLTAGEMYKWVDDKGVVNYSNEPPPKIKGGKAPTIVEDRVSVYTPEKAVTEEIERNKNRRPQAAAAPERRTTAATPPPPPVAYDPCANPNDPNCQPGVLYDGSPVFNGRRRPQPLGQPQLPPGAIAGQTVGPDAYIAGQSASAPPIVAPARPQTAPLRDKERETSLRRP